MPTGVVELNQAAKRGWVGRVVEGESVGGESVVGESVEGESVEGESVSVVESAEGMVGGLVVATSSTGTSAVVGVVVVVAVLVVLVGFLPGSVHLPFRTWIGFLYSIVERMVLPTVLSNAAVEAFFKTDLAAEKKEDICVGRSKRVEKFLFYGTVLDG